MSYKIFSIPPFDKQLKRLSKKYPSLKSDFAALVDDLANKPRQGTPLGKSCFKIRMSISSKGKGKSGGARIITNIVVTQNTVFLLAIYDKSNKETITDMELKELLKSVPE